MDDRPTDAVGGRRLEIDLVEGMGRALRTASMTEMGAACVASTGSDLLTGSAAAMIMYPVVPDPRKYPETGRHPVHTRGEMGLFGHWIKYMLHYLFIYKARALPGWPLIPE